MFARQALRSTAQVAGPRLFSTSAANNRAVAVLGASGGIGQPVSSKFTRSTGTSFFSNQEAH